MLGFGTIAKKVFGTPNDRKIKGDAPIDRPDQRIGTGIREAE